ncbi:radical SAM protein [Lentimicrobium sp.]|jgi:radical SAM protein with 4Fe4S-binding SPASM domain|uniref:radical SAM protein n=1 Tax=Lentimicrobium sp. TaxID=2034841 RepID=UPI002BBA362E|nr:radical SAM protein [Lentimicrobium sp.]HPF64936.1 radical SAM protein [Lentimicrobium sp.]HPR26896.1 radical SAM protein [Lentimicrobium sp.]
MMKTAAQDIKDFFIPLGQGDVYFVRTQQDVWLVLSPLANAMLLAKGDAVQQLGSLLRNDNNRYVSPQLATAATAAKALSRITPAGDRIARISAPKDLQKLSILPTQACNLSCSYCYAAGGRSAERLGWEKLSGTLDYFIDAGRLKSRYLTISFIGGGEPMLEWELVKKGIEYAGKRAGEQGFRVDITLITNGTVMNDEMAGFLKMHRVLPNISFDILEDVQQKQRGHYEKVMATLDCLIRSGHEPSVNATITPENVGRMDQMADRMFRRFPAVKSMIFEPVVDPHTFATAQELGGFYAKFTREIFRVRQMAREKGCIIECRILNNIGEILDRGCPPKLTLTPRGDLTICYCVSSPLEKSFEKRVYGWADDQGNLSFDQEKFSDICSENVYSFNKCEHCFAKWYCAGGCMCPNDLYDEARLEVLCDFTRELVAQELTGRVQRRHFRDKGEDILQILSSGEDEISPVYPVG